jgi:hypothetical protein
MKFDLLNFSSSYRPRRSLIALSLLMQFMINSGCSIQGDIKVTSDGSHDPQSMALVAQPTNEKVNSVFSTAASFQLLDKNGRRATTSTTTVTLSLTSGAGILTGTLSARAVNGLATFSDLKLDHVGTGFSITASSAFGSSATSAFKVDYSPIVLGQPSFDRNLNLEKGFNSFDYASSDGTRFFVADIIDNRVMIWNQIPLNRESVDVVLGQPNKYSTGGNNGGISASSLWRPVHVHSDGTKIAVVDYSNNRVLIWNSIPTIDSTPADLVLGQANFTTNASGLSASALSAPSYVYWTSTRFFVVDQGNHRVLVWSSFPTSNNQAADYVLGQPNMTSNAANNGGGPTAQTLSTPCSVTSDGTRLIVTDYDNSRVLIWNPIPTATGQAADLVVGQPNLISNTVNNGGIGAKTLNTPTDAFSDGSKLYVMDYSNIRALIWNTIPTTNFEAASVVIGQPDFTSTTTDNGGLSKGFYDNEGIIKVGTKLMVSDYQHARVMVWNTVPTSNHVAADAAIGQDDLNQVISKNGGVSAQRLGSSIWGTYTDGQKFAVADTGNSRILIWNTLPTAMTQAADLVLGQPDMTSNSPNNGGLSVGLNSPMSICSDGTKLVVVDRSNNRALIWNSFPTVTQEAANVVLGQPDLTSNSSNTGGLSAHSLWLPASCHVDEGGKLYIADQRNNRLLIWNSIPTANQTNADVVLGQPDMTSGTANNGGRTAHSLVNPWGVYAKNGKLYIADLDNQRVLIWNVIPTSNQANADVVLGQPDMTSGTANNGGISAQSLYYPRAVSVVGSKLYVSDGSNNRILVWNSVPTVNQTAADAVLGQTNFSSNTANSGGLSATSLSAPWGAVSSFTFDGNSYLLITDSGNGRVLLQP